MKIADRVPLKKSIHTFYIVFIILILIINKIQYALTLDVYFFSKSMLFLQILVHYFI